MKKNNLLLLLLIGLCTFVCMGTVVKAANVTDSNTTFTNPTIVCDPESVGDDGTSTCYYIGNIDGEIEGFIVDIYTMDGIDFDDSQSGYIYSISGVGAPKVNILEDGGDVDVSLKNSRLLQFNFINFLISPVFAEDFFVNLLSLFCCGLLWIVI